MDCVVNGVEVPQNINEGDPYSTTKPPYTHRICYQPHIRAYKSLQTMSRGNLKSLVGWLRFLSG